MDEVDDKTCLGAAAIAGCLGSVLWVLATIGALWLLGVL